MNTKNGIGEPVRRTEDPQLLRGQGRYTDDLNEPGQAYAWIVRSPYAHGILKTINSEAARSMPGVIAVFTGEDLKGYGTHKCIVQLENLKKTPRRSLMTDKVRFVGDPVAFVVAETALQARDAAEAVELDVEPLPAVALASEAARPGAPQIWDEAPGNVACDFRYGDREKVAEAFARAAHVTRLELRNTRVVNCALEPRAAICSYDAATQRFTLVAPGQGVFAMKNQLVDLLGVSADKVRILTWNVGGSFGMKGSIYPEYVCLAHAARALGRPIKWTNDRSGSFLADQQGRDHERLAELALDKDGAFLAVRLTGYANVGAYLAVVGPQPPTLNAVKNTPSVYRTPLLEVRTQVMFTNTAPVSAYRGAGRPEANYFMERLIDEAAVEMGIDRIELRRRNHIRPEQMPFNSSSGQVFDTGEFTAVLDAALKISDFDDFKKRKAESRSRGKLRGIGVGSYLEQTAPPNKEMGAIRFETEGDLAGAVTLVTGTLDHGQAHRTALAQVLAPILGVPFESIRLVQGDSDQVVFGAGTGGSRSIMMSGGAAVEASAKVIAQGKALAGEHFETAAADIEFRDGKFSVAGTDRAISILELARKYPKKMDASHVTEVVPSAFPNGCHVAEVEIDPETGVVEVVRYASANDFGTIVNPMLVEGQIHGGVAQGLGQVLMENAQYDAEGQLLTGSFMDYALPRASDTPREMGFVSHPVPAKTNPLGAKGCGEAGCAGAMTSLTNAIVDALSEYGIRRFDMPASPQRVWQAINSRKSGSGTDFR